MKYQAMKYKCNLHIVSEEHTTKTCGRCGCINNFIGSSSGNYTLSGVRNMSIGASTMGSLTTGSDNISFGVLSQRATTTGSDNIGIGTSSPMSKPAAAPAADTTEIGRAHV